MDHAESFDGAYRDRGLDYEENGTEIPDETNSASSDGQESNDEGTEIIQMVQNSQEVAKRPMKQELNSASPTSVSPAAQEYKQRNFLVAQLVDSDDANVTKYQRRASHDDRHNTNYHFAALTEQESSPDNLLSKLIQEQNQRHETHSTDSRMGENREAVRSNQMADAQHRPGQKSSQSNSEDHQKNRGVDLDEHVKLVDLFGIQIVALTINGKERLCLAQISNTLLKDFSYNEIHNRRVALGITCVQCTPIQLEMLRRAGAMPSSSRRCGMITMREAERLCRSFLAEEQPPELPENFYFTVAHRVNYGCKGRFVPARYISSRAKCIECFYCGEYYSPNKFIFHSHKQPDATDCNPPDSPNINSWRKHINLDWTQEHSQEIKYAWEDVKSLFNGGTRRRTSLSGLGFVGDQLVVSAPPTGTESGARKSNEQTTKTSGRSSTSTSGGRKHPHLAGLEDESNIDVVVCEGRHVEQRTNLPLTQNERRKIPIGAWAKDRQQQLAVDHGQNISACKRPASHFNNPYDNVAQQQMKRLAVQNSLQQQQLHQHQQHQRPPAASKSVMHMPMLTEQQSPLYQLNYPYHPEPAGAAQRQAARLANMSQAQQANMNSTSVKYEPQPHRDPNSGLANPNDPPQANKSPISTNSTINSGGNNGQEQILSMPSSFIYGQLYSQLMQTQLAQQVSQRQQQRITPIEAQLALRQHIWSSLLANLRCNQNQLEQPAGNLQGPKLNSSQLPAYCSTNSLSQQQQTNSLLVAAAAAAATASASATSGNHSTPVQQAIEANDLTNLSLSAPSNSNALSNLIPVRMYATNALAQANDMAAIFNGANDITK